MPVQALSNEMADKIFNEVGNPRGMWVYWDDNQQLVRTKWVENNVRIKGHIRRFGGRLAKLPPPGVWRPPNNHDRYCSKVTYSNDQPGLWTGHYLGQRYEVRHTGHPFPYDFWNLDGWWGGSPDYVQSDYNIATRCDVECLVKLGQKKLDVSVALAEARRTAEMLTNSTKTFYRALLAIKRRDFRKAAKELDISWRKMRNGKALSSRHLEYQYGWKPLMSDIHSAYELLQKQLNGHLYLRCTKHVKDEISIPDGWQGHPRQDHEFYGHVRRTKIEVKRDHGTTLFAKLDDPNLSLAQQLGLNNPLTLGWELIPYSFLVDWALPVGSMLEALSATSGLTFLGGYRSVHADFTCQVKSVPWADYVGSTYTADIKAFAYRRRVLQDFPGVRPYAKDPLNSAVHAASLGALILQARK